jgi:hypothetical protein
MAEKGPNCGRQVCGDHVSGMRRSALRSTVRNIGGKNKPRSKEYAYMAIVKGLSTKAGREILTKLLSCPRRCGRDHRDKISTKSDH